MSAASARSGNRGRAANEFAWSLAFCAGLGALPLVIDNDYWLGVLIVAMYFAMLAAAWNLLAGYTGQFSLAPAGFAMIGAYTTGLLAYHWNVPPIFGIIAAVAVAGGIGLVLGRIVLRLKGAYLALTTLSFAEIARLVVGNSIDFTRGDLGLSVPAILRERVAYFYLFLGVLMMIQTGLYLLLRSRVGLYLRAIRDDETAAASRGVRVVRWKTVAFSISAGLSGVAGALYAHFALLISPELGLISQTGLIISMVVIGGIGTLVGPVVGAILVYVTSELLRGFGGWQLVVFALLVIVFARFFREGFWGLLRRALRPRPAALVERAMARGE